MAPVLTRLRAEFRARWRAWGATALLIGVATGAVLTTAAGARRTGSAYARFLRSSHSSDLLVSPKDSGFPNFYDALAHRPGAVSVAPLIGYEVVASDRPDRPLAFFARSETDLADALDRPKLTSGRFYRPGNANEVVVDITAAHLLHLHSGSRLRLRLARTDERAHNAAHDAILDARVVGIAVTRDSVVFVNALGSEATLFGGPAFVRRFGPEYRSFDGAIVELAAGTSRSRFVLDGQSLARRFPETGGVLFATDQWEQAAQVEHAIRPEAVALGLFAALIALVALFAVGQVVARQLFVASTDNEVLRSLGMSRSQLLAVALVEVGAVATAGAILAVIFAIAASPVMPIGPARLAEPHPGFALDWTVLGIGCLATVALLVLAVGRPAWRAAARGSESERALGRRRRRPSRLAQWATEAAAPPSVGIGVGHAVDPGRGRTAVPVRSALAVTAVAVATITASLTFGANLSRLVHTPRLYGQSWDITADAQFSVLPRDKIVTLLRNDPSVQTWTFGEHADVTVAGRVVTGITLSTRDATLLAPTVIEGRSAQHPGEIALGTKTLQRAHLHVGQRVLVDVASQPKPALSRIVGRSVFPFFGIGSFTPTGLGTGAQVYQPRPVDWPNFNFLLVSIKPGPRHDAEVAALSRELGGADYCGLFNQCHVSAAIRPTDILNYTRVQGTPIALATLLALLAVGVLGSFLATSIRRRRRDFAILKTLGFSRRQVSSTVAWEATTVVLLALAIGLPAGVALGRSVWALFARNLGAPVDPIAPIVTMLVTVPVALLVSNALAAIPGIRARRLHPAVVFRAE